MARNSELEAHRALVRKRVQDVNRKIRRLEKEGVNLAGTEFDPRRPQAPIHKYNTSQLVAYKRKLDNFQSRKTQFVGDTHARPIPIAEWRGYLRPQRAATKFAQRIQETLNSIFVEPTGLTIGQREAAMRDTLFPRTANSASNNPLQVIQRIPKQIESRKALERLTKDMQRKVGQASIDEFVKRSRVEARSLMKYRVGLAERFDQLTDKQFHIIWAYSGVAMELSQDYENIMNARNGDEKRPDKETYDSNNESINQLLDWAVKIK